MANETIVVASFSHETNTFVKNPRVTDRGDFQARREYFDDAVVENLRGTETMVGGLIDVADEEGIDLRPVLAAGATPGAPVERETYEFYSDRIVEGVREHLDDLDGVILPLHGAMVPEHLHDGEGPLIARVRDVVGPDVPISVTLDLHGNVTDEMLAEADALVGYKEYPHLDKAETGRLGMNVLIDTVRGEVDPVMHVERPPQILYQPKAYTQSGPMAEIMAQAREHERRDGVLGVSVFVGYYHADIPEMGVSTPVITDDDPALAREVARDLATTVWERRVEFVEDYPDPETAVAEAKALAEEADDAGPVVMGDFGSNPGGGGASDGTTIPRAMLEQGVDNAGYAIMYDPDVVEQALDAGVGSSLTVTLGGKTDDQHGDPIEDLDVYVKAITDGRYVNTGTSHEGYGVQNDLGTTVHLTCGTDRTLDVIVSGVRESAFDAEVWRHIGIMPERLDVLCIPSFIAFLGDYKPLSSAVVLADTPGASAVNPARFEYDHIPRPLYPLDADADITYPSWE
jgi:microcystin degradation protein MlrC